MALAAPDLISKIWQETDEQVKNDYGNVYFERFKSDIEKVDFFHRKNIYEVVDAITKGVIKKSPECSYRCIGLFTRLITLIWDFAPVQFTDFIWDFISTPKVKPKALIIKLK